DTHIVPHEAADLGPVLLDDHLFVRVGDPAFVPRTNCGRRAKLVPIRDDMLRGGLAEDEAFEQAVRGEAVRAVETALGYLTRGIKAWKVGAPIEVDQHSAAGIMLRGYHRYRLPCHVDTERQQLFMNVREMSGDEIRI